MKYSSLKLTRLLVYGSCLLVSALHVRFSMALLCWRHGEGLLLQLVCLFVYSSVVASFKSVFYVFHVWTKCANSLDMVGAVNCVLRVGKLNWRRSELVLAWLILSGQVVRCLADGFHQQRTAKLQLGRAACTAGQWSTTVTCTAAGGSGRATTPWTGPPAGQQGQETG